MKEIDEKTLSLLITEFYKVCETCETNDRAITLYLRFMDVLESHSKWTSEEFKNKIMKQYNLEKINKGE